jgi:DNA repair exonuclease SbcCD ATPase subunit
LGISWHIMDATVMESATCLSRTDNLTAEVAALRCEVRELRRLVAELRCEVGYWKSRHADALNRNQSLQEELAQAKAEIRKLNGRLFGRKSEQHAVRERTDLLRRAEEQPEPRRRRGAQPGHNGHGRRDHSHLPTREAVIEVPQDQRVCPRCGKPMREMAETEDSEQIEIEVYRRRLRRKRYPKLTDWAIDWLKRIRQLYRLNRARLNCAIGSPEFNTADQQLRAAVEQIKTRFGEELVDAKLRLPCRKALKSLQNPWEGLLRFVDDPGIPMDNNRSERLLRGPAMGRKNYYGSGAKWSGRLAETMFSILATLRCWNLNGRTWLSWYLDACTAAGGHAPKDIAPFLPWNFTPERRPGRSTHRLKSPPRRHLIAPASSEPIPAPVRQPTLLPKSSTHGFDECLRRMVSIRRTRQESFVVTAFMRSFPGFRPDGPDESGHYERVGRMLTTHGP